MITKNEGVNFDYILVLAIDDERRYIVKEIEINRHDNLIQNLLNMNQDDHYDVEDMYKIYSSYVSVKNSPSFNYCLKYHYLNSYVDVISSPNFDSEKYKRDLETRTDAIRYFYSKDSNFYSRIAEKRTNELKQFIINRKRSFLTNALGYLYALDYNSTLVCNNIEHNFLLYSHEKIGRQIFIKDINQDLKVYIKTNFCFGSSSYFQVIIKYKNIELLPYSEWTKYYYAKYDDINSCTRSYTVSRNSWRYCLEFISNFINETINNPDTFINEEIRYEVEELFSGIEHIFYLSDDRLKKIITVR